jgi:hypothetical protein
MSIFKARPRLWDKKENKPTATSKAINLLLVLLYIGSIVSVPIFTAKLVSGAPPDININPDAPEDVKTRGEKVGGFLYWLAWLGIFVVGAIGVLLLIAGKKTLGLTILALAILGAIVLASWSGVIKWFG